MFIAEVLQASVLDPEIECIVSIRTCYSMRHFTLCLVISSMLTWSLFVCFYYAAVSTKCNQNF